MKIYALVTAAGLSSRMKDFKPLMKIGERTMADRVIDNLSAVGVERIVMVTGFRADELEAALSERGVEFVRNDNYRTTKMFDSVKIGLRKLTEGGEKFDRFLFTPIDVPMVSQATIRRVLECEAPIVFPQYDGRIGHPIAIDSRLAEEILSYNGECGLRGALENSGAEIVRLNVQDAGITQDADTQEDYRKMQDLNKIRRRIVIVRHGTPVSYEEDVKRYRGCVDLELSENGRLEAEAAGRTLAAEGIKGPLYSSHLIRAYDTADIIGRVLAERDGIKRTVSVKKGIKEIEVGDWEGIPVDEVKERWPEVYEARGRDLYNTPFPGGESFRMVGERWGKCFEEILEENKDNNDDIIIAGHSGGISAFLVNQGLMNESDFFKNPMPCGGITLINMYEDGMLSLQKVGFKSVDELTDREINRLYNKCAVPGNVIKHMRAVADYQDELLDKLEAAGLRYDRQLLRKAALLHDIARLEKDHAEAGAKLIAKEGFASIAELVAKHHSPERDEARADGDGRAAAKLTPADILFYADKRIKDYRLVSIDERFAASRAKCNTEEAVKKHDSLYIKAKEIETEINNLIDKI